MFKAESAAFVHCPCFSLLLMLLQLLLLPPTAVAVKDATGRVIWRSRLSAGTLASAAVRSGHSYRAVLNSNGNFVVVDDDRRPLWATKTARSKQLGSSQ